MTLGWQRDTNFRRRPNKIYNKRGRCPITIAFEEDQFDKIIEWADRYNISFSECVRMICTWTLDDVKDDEV